VGERRNESKISVGNSERKRGWEDNIKMDLKEGG
jgi:hypothetical protein